MNKKAEYDKVFLKNNYKQFKINLSIKSDKDILDHLASQGNKQGYVKELIRQDIKKSISK